MDAGSDDGLAEEKELQGDIYVEQLYVVQVGGIAFPHVIGNVVGIPSLGDAATALHVGSHHFEVRLVVHIAFIDKVDLELRICPERAQAQAGQVSPIERGQFHGGIHLEVRGRIFEIRAVIQFGEGLQPRIVDFSLRLREPLAPYKRCITHETPRKVGTVAETVLRPLVIAGKRDRSGRQHQDRQAFLNYGSPNLHFNVKSKKY